MEEKGIKVKEIADRLSALNAMNVMVMTAKSADKIKDDPDAKEDLSSMVIYLAQKIGYKEGDMVYVGGGDSYGVLVLHTEDNRQATIHMLALEDSGKEIIEEVVKTFTDIINTDEK